MRNWFSDLNVVFFFATGTLALFFLLWVITHGLAGFFVSAVESPRPPATVCMLMVAIGFFYGIKYVENNPILEFRK